MLHRHKAPKSRWMLITAIFLGVIALLIAGVVLVRVISVFEHSHFDGHHELIVEFNKSPNTAAIVAFSPDLHTASILWVKAPKVDVVNLKKQLQIPIDATVISSPDTSGLKQLVSDLFFHHIKSHTILTLVDAFNLLVYTYTLPSSAISEKEIHLSGDSFTPDESNVNSSLIGQLFVDNTLYHEAISISVLNATGVSGVGNSVAKLLTNIGANVIAVNTSNKIEDSSKITFIGEKQYSQTRISKVLGFPLSTFPAPLLSDIMVIIGKDHANDFR